MNERRKMYFNLQTLLKLQVALTIFAGTCLIQVFPINAQESESSSKPIRYSVDFNETRNHYLNISMTVPVNSDSTELMMAVWTPGSYLVREYARHIDSLEMTAKGKPVPFEKTRKNRWTVDTKGLKSFRVKYRLYCNEMSVRTNWVGKQYAMINGAPTFLTVVGRLENKHVVNLNMPPNWKRSATSLEPFGDSTHTYVANNFDELVDSPIVAGNISVYPFKVGGVPHQLVNIGESGYWDGMKAARDLKKVVKAHQEMWGNIPYDRYLFLNMIAETGGGLEHDNSTLIMTSRWSFREPSRYESWLSLASHEFFHTWNVRRLRPTSLVKYDYENEVYTPSLWIAEGITSYYEDLLLVRAGLISQNAYLGRLSQNVETVQRTVGRTKQSLKDSSYDTWIKFYRPDENSSNTRISYYSKGAVVAFLLDAKIRKTTDGKKSLDDVMRKMYSDFSESGYTTADFRSTVKSVAGEDLSDWFASAVDSTDELDFSDISFLGVAVPNEKKSDDAESAESKSDSKTEPEKEEQSKQTGKKAKVKSKGEPVEGDTTGDSKQATQKADTERSKGEGDSKSKDANSKEEAKKAETKSNDDKPSAPAKKKASAAKPRPWIGLSTSTEDGKVNVSRVKPESPSADAGLNIDDEIIAINGFRVSGSVDSRLRQYQVGDEVEVLIARRGKLMRVDVEIGSQEVESWRLKFIPKPSKAQQRQKLNWMGPGKK